MKKKLQHTTVSVKLRKSEIRNEWYLYVEAYPVYEKENETPKRVREYVKDLLGEVFNRNVISMALSCVNPR